MTKPVRTTLLEAVGLILLAGAVGLAGNAVRQRGLDLSRNYFREWNGLAKAKSQPTRPAPVDAGGAVPDLAGTVAPALGADAALETGALADLGVKIIETDRVIACFQDCAYEPGALDNEYVFIDARSDEDYARGHIPGAVQVDHYFIEEYLPDVVPIVEMAEHAVVYCNGGDCEDSGLVIMDLIEQGISPSKLYLFKGGWEAWVAACMPVEEGP
jgi:rhodanese-related sulfurtransferase